MRSERVGASPPKLNRVKPECRARAASANTRPRRRSGASRSWICKLFARPPRTIRKAPTRYRPRVEALEDRAVPAINLLPAANYAAGERVKRSITRRHGGAEQ